MKKNYLLIGTFDLLHSGHINLMYKASKEADVYVMVTSDKINDLNPEKGKMFLSEETRMSMIKGIDFIKDVVIFDPEKGVKIEDYIKENEIDGIVYGNEYIGDEKKENLARKNNIKLIFFDRTKTISSTELRKEIIKRLK